MSKRPVAMFRLWEQKNLHGSQPENPCMVKSSNLPLRCSQCTLARAVLSSVPFTQFKSLIQPGTIFSANWLDLMSAELADTLIGLTHPIRPDSWTYWSDWRIQISLIDLNQPDRPESVWIRWKWDIEGTLTGWAVDGPSHGTSLSHLLDVPPMPHLGTVSVYSFNVPWMFLQCSVDVPDRNTHGASIACAVHGSWLDAPFMLRHHVTRMLRARDIHGPSPSCLVHDPAVHATPWASLRMARGCVLDVPGRDILR